MISIHCSCFSALNPDLYLQEAVQVLKKKVTQMTDKMKSLEEILESNFEENKVYLRCNIQLCMPKAHNNIIASTLRATEDFVANGSCHWPPSYHWVLIYQ